MFYPADMGVFIAWKLNLQTVQQGTAQLL